nr:hypothetical protein [Tanacetum cinerariifolium]
MAIIAEAEIITTTTFDDNPICKQTGEDCIVQMVKQEMLSHYRMYITSSQGYQSPRVFMNPAEEHMKFCCKQLENMGEMWRQITDGSLLVNEIILWAKKHMKNLFLHKVDFEKSFDSLVKNPYLLPPCFQPLSEFQQKKAFRTSMSRSNNWSTSAHRFKKRLSKWNCKTPSYGGR